MSLDSTAMDGPSLEKASDAIHVLLNQYQDQVVPGLAYLQDPEQRIVELAMATRSVSLVEAALTLAEDGFGRETMMLNRPLFELMLDAYWASIDTEHAREMFLSHARYTQHLQKQTFRRYPELGVDVHEEMLPPDEFERSRKLFGRYASRSWTGLSLSARVEIFEQKLDVRNRRELRFVFEILHDLSNAEIHPSSWSLSRALRVIPTDDGDRFLQIRSGPEPELASFALTHTWWIFVRLLNGMHFLTEVSTDSLQAAVDVGSELLELDSPDEGT